MSGPTILAADTFGRTSTSGWGTAPTGGAWTVASGAANLTVAGGVGKMTLAKGVTRVASLTSVTALNSNTLLDVTVEQQPVGGGGLALVTARKSAGGEYRLRLSLNANNTVAVSITRVVGTTETVLGTVTATGVSTTSTLRARFQVQGTSTTTLTGSVWNASGSEPATPTITRTDSTASLQTAGSPALTGYLASTVSNGPITLDFDNLSVTSN
ncbi:hypothetical protein ABIB25_005620 [Nakamurella sp. UYEF19]